MKSKVLVATLLSTLVILSACGAESTQESETQDIKELVNEYSSDMTNDKSASITSQQLIVTESDNSALAYDLPKDEFFVSIAPYVNETHH